MMKSLFATTALSGLLSAGAFAATAATDKFMTQADQAMFASTLIGETVYDRQGKDAESIGEIDDLIVHKDGSVLIGQEAVDLGRLAGALARRKNADPELVVSLRADSAVPYETIFRALEAVRSAGARLDLANLPDRPR